VKSKSMSSFVNVVNAMILLHNTSPLAMGWNLASHGKFSFLYLLVNLSFRQL